MRYSNNPVLDAERDCYERDKAWNELRNEHTHGYIDCVWGDVVDMDEAYDYALEHYDFEEGESEEDYTEEEMIMLYFESMFGLSKWRKF